jgi:hypothetical protein
MKILPLAGYCTLMGESRPKAEKKKQKSTNDREENEEQIL